MNQGIRQVFNCQKKLNELDADGTHFFCQTCAKKVHDFSRSSKAEIHETLLKEKSAVCAVIPQEYLSTEPGFANKIYVPKWSFLVGLAFLFGNLKALFAQRAPLQSDSEEKTIPLGYQKIKLSGNIHTRENKGIEGALLVFSFHQQDLGSCKTDAQGNFEFNTENFGGIRNIDVHVFADGFLKKMIKQVNIDKQETEISLLLERNERNLNTDFGDGLLRVGGIAIIKQNKATNALVARHFLGTEIFEDILPRSYYAAENPVKYADKLNYPVQVTDWWGKGIVGAKVELLFNNGEKRYGITGDMGIVRLNVQLENKASAVKIRITADGYKTEKRWDFNLEQNDMQNFVLKPTKAGLS